MNYAAACFHGGLECMSQGHVDAVCRAACPCFVDGLETDAVDVKVSSCPVEWARRMKEMVSTGPIS